MEFPNPLSCKKDLIRLGVMELRLSYKKGLKGTVLTLISMHETIKKFLQTPDLLKCLAGWTLPLGIIRSYPTFGLNGLCLTKGYDFRVLCLNWNTISVQFFPVSALNRRWFKRWWSLVWFYSTNNKLLLF